MKEVKPPKKPLIFYYAAAMLAVILLNSLAVPWLAQHQIRDVDYNTFVEMTEKGEVGKCRFGRRWFCAGTRGDDECLRLRCVGRVYEAPKMQH